MVWRGRLRVHVVGILALVGVLASPAAPSIPAAANVATAAVDPLLATQIAARGFTPAILTWDRTAVDRAEVAAYLADEGLGAHVMDGLSIALACASSSEDINTMAAAPGAVSVWADHALHPALDRSVRTAFNGDPGAVWQGLGITGKGVAIGVVDTGVDASHPDLQYGPRTKLNVRVVASKEDILGPNQDPCGITDTYTEQLTDSELTSGHGTHLAGVAAGDGTVSGGKYTGVAPGADIIGAGVAETITPQAKVEQTAQLSLLGALAGINYVLLNGLEGCFPPFCSQFKPLTAKVILAGWTQEGLHEPWHPMTWIVRDLGWYGINVVFPAGNEGPTTSDCSAAQTCHFNPFAVGAIGVAATPKESRTSLASYSSRGDPVPREARGETILYEPLLAAPGTGVVAARRPGVSAFAQPPGSILGAGPHSEITLDRRYVALTGTSVAAAHVAGAIALMQEAAVKATGCYLPADQIIEILRTTASPMAGLESWEVGAGALDVTAAVDAAIAAPKVPSPDPWMCPPAS